MTSRSIEVRRPARRRRAPGGAPGSGRSISSSPSHTRQSKKNTDSADRRPRRRWSRSGRRSPGTDGAGRRRPMAITSPSRTTRSPGSARDDLDDLGQPRGDVVQTPGEQPDRVAVSVRLDADAVELGVEADGAPSPILAQRRRRRPARWRRASGAPARRPAGRRLPSPRLRRSARQPPPAQWRRPASPPAGPARAGSRTRGPARPAPSSPMRPAGSRRRSVGAGSPVRRGRPAEQLRDRSRPGGRRSGTGQPGDPLQLGVHLADRQ